MNIEQHFINAVVRNQIGQYIIHKQGYRIVLTATCSLLFNLFYALYYGILGINTLSLWFISMCAYYTILAVTRFLAVLCEYKGRSMDFIHTNYFIMKMSGVLLILLSLILAAIIYISMTQDMATKYNEITMITIATYTFAKITMTLIKAVKHHRNTSSLLLIIYYISYAEVAVSILNLQRSMIASFGKMANSNILNRLTGVVVCLFVLILGILIMKKTYRKGK